MHPREPRPHPAEVAYGLIAWAEDRLPSPPPLEDPLADVELSVERFVRQDQACREADSRVPALLDEQDEPIPIDIGLPDPGNDPAVLYRLAPTLVQLVASNGVALDRHGLRPVVLVPADTARDSFRSKLASFLGIRLSGNGQGPAAPPGYLFDVSTNTPGLRVHYSPAYFLNTRLAFGSPTTPVASYLQPGRYTFGAYPPAGGYWDGTEYDVPGPTYTAHLAV